MLDPTQSFGAYRILERIGDGAFGSVYLAYQSFLDRQVAIKTLHADVQPASEQQFMHEARTIARLRHPNIVTVYEFGTMRQEDHPFTYMVMEYLPGDTLQQRMRAGKLSVVEVLQILTQLASALDYAHAQNVIHRDLKPSNIMFDAHGHAIIVDFGLARLIEIGGREAGPNTIGVLESSVSGTPAYMSPEQARGTLVGPPSDLYSLATITYELLTGSRPFNGKNPSELIRARLFDTPHPLGSPFPKAAEIAMQRALAFEPTERFASAGEFATALRDALLPDPLLRNTVTYSDPIQAARLQRTRRTSTRVLWALVAVIFVLNLFVSTEFLRGFLNSDSPFISDGILASRSVHDQGRDVLFVWPGSPAARAGVQPGDFIRYDLHLDRQNQAADFLINGRPRSAYPANWLAHADDKIERTVYRAQQPIQIAYQLQRSNVLLVTFLIQLPLAILAYCCALWLMRRWPGEVRLSLCVILCLLVSFFLTASAAGALLINLDTLAAYFLLALLLRFVLTYPEGARLSPPLWVLLLPTTIGILEFLMQQEFLIREIALDTIAVDTLGLIIGLAVIVKWLGHDLKRYPALGWVIFTVVSFGVIGGMIDLAHTLDDYATVSQFFGDGLSFYILLYAVEMGVGGFNLIVGLIGVHRVQLQIGSAVPIDRVNHPPLLRADR
jgi:serine/threonine protein kinase